MNALQRHKVNSSNDNRAGRVGLMTEKADDMM